MEYISCNLCGSTRTKEKFLLRDYLLDRPDQRVILVQCLECGLVYQNPQPSQDELNTSYPDYYEPFNSNERSPTSGFINWIRNHGIQKRIQTITRHVQGGRLLDIGCASGTFLRALQTHANWELYGIEPNPSVAESARKQTGLNIFTGTLNQSSFPDNHFDVVTLWDVLEHLPDPGAALCEIERILKPGGIIAIRIPNFDSLEAKIFGKYWVGLDAPRHLFVFGKKQLKKLLAKYKFQSAEIKSGIGSYPNLVLSLRFWLTAHQTSFSIRKSIISLLEFLPVKSLMAPFFYLIDQTGYGSSMVVVSFKENPR